MEDKRIDALEEEWIPVNNKLPESEVMVLAYFKNEYGKHRRIRAMYAPQFTVESSMEDEECVDYDAEKDNYYLPEGWYEQNEFEDTHWHVDASITHWMPLPDPPEGKNGN